MGGCLMHTCAELTDAASPNLLNLCPLATAFETSEANFVRFSRFWLSVETKTKQIDVGCIGWAGNTGYWDGWKLRYMPWVLLDNTCGVKACGGYSSCAEIVACASQLLSWTACRGCWDWAPSMWCVVSCRLPSGNIFVCKHWLIA